MKQHVAVLLLLICSCLMPYSTSSAVPLPPELTLEATGLSVTLNWTSATGADGYKLYYAPYPYTGPASIGSIDMGTDTSVSFMLWDGAAFFAAVTAYDETGESRYSNSELFLLSPYLGQSADAPELVVETDALDVRTAWTEIPSATNYRIYYAPYPFTDTDTIGFVDLGLVKEFNFSLWDGAAYYLAVSAVEGGKETGLSNVELLVTANPVPEWENAGYLDADTDGYSLDEGDCDDSDPDINPDAVEVCGNGVDEDCSGEDEVCPEVDGDNDGFTAADGDCDDTDPGINPIAVEICGNSIDEDCDGVYDQCPAEMPDLYQYAPIPDFNMVRPSTLSPGDSFTYVNWAVRNDGDADSGQFISGLYLSTDMNITPADRLLWSTTTANLAPGDSVEMGELILNIPNDVSAGNYYIGPYVDTQDSVVESDESNNNSMYGGVFIIGLQPDLIVSTGPVAPISVAPGETVTLSDWTIANQGPGVSMGTVDSGIFLSTDAVITPADVPMATFNDFSLEGDDGYYTFINFGSETVTIPPGTVPGIYYIGSIVDFNNDVAESDESNNYVVQQITVTEAPLPDLVFTSGEPWVTPTTVYPQEYVHVSNWSYINQGGENSSSYSITFYLSTDPIITSADTFLTQFNIPGGANDDIEIEGPLVSGLIPLDTEPGTYYVGILLDSGNTVDESDESNNYVSKQITVLSYKPDLIISSGSPTATPSSVVPGNTVLLSQWRILNQGEGPSGAFTNGFYLSTDPVITPKDTYLSGNSNIYIIGPGDYYDWDAQSLMIPSNTPPGAYYVGILVDREDSVDESNEENNYVSRKITILELLTGNWHGNGSSSISPCTVSLSAFLVESGKTISGSGSMTGKCGSGSGSITGTISGSTISFSISFSKGNVISFAGTLSGDRQSMTGTYSWPSAGDNGTWSLNK